jgi:tetratricopeptide (TPR) repeat protein
VKAAQKGSDTEKMSYEDAKLFFEDEKTKSWLLIFDNADNPNLNYFDFFPSGNSGCILMTTRLPECQQYSNLGPQEDGFEKLATNDSVELLLKSAQIPGERRVHTIVDAEKVVGDDCLTQHALAITQAGAFIRQGLCTLAEYPTTFVRQRQRLLEHHPKQAASQYGDVYATFEVSATVMEQGSPNHQDWADALELLKVLAFLHREGVPEEVFTKAWDCSREYTETDQKDDVWLPSVWHAIHIRKVLRHYSSSPDELNIISLREARSALKSFSLITVHPDTGDISMHPLVHAWVRDRLESEAQKTAWATTASILAFSVDHFEHQELFRKIHSHIEICATPCPQIFFANDSYPPLDICRIFYRFFWVVYRIGQNTGLSETIANTLYSRIGLEIPPRSLNWRYLSYIQVVMKQNAREYDEALALLKEVVSYDEDILSPEDLDVLVARRTLGELYTSVGEYPKAIDLLKNDIVMRRKLLDPDHRYILRSQYELARAYMKNRQLDKAIALLEEVVQIEEKTLAPSHPDRLSSQHNLARAYMKNRQLDKAIALLEGVVQIDEKTLAPSHPYRLSSQHNLARAYTENRQLDQAIALLEEVVQIEEKTLAPSHPDRLSSQHELARAYYQNGGYLKSLSIIKEVVQTDELLPGNRKRVISQELLADCLKAIEEHGLMPRSVPIPENCERQQR